MNFQNTLTTLASQSSRTVLFGQEKKNSNVDNFLPDLHNNPSTFSKSLGLLKGVLRRTSLERLWLGVAWFLVWMVEWILKVVAFGNNCPNNTFFKSLRS